MFEPSTPLVSLKAILMPSANDFMLAVAANAMRATTKAYSTRSWPASEANKQCNLNTSFDNLFANLAAMFVS